MRDGDERAASEAATIHVLLITCSFVRVAILRLSLLRELVVSLRLGPRGSGGDTTPPCSDVRARLQQGLLRSVQSHSEVRHEIHISEGERITSQELILGEVSIHDIQTLLRLVGMLGHLCLIALAAEHRSEHALSNNAGDLRGDGSLLERDPLLHDGALVRIRRGELASAGLVHITSDGTRLVHLEVTVLQYGDLSERLTSEVSRLLVLALAEVDGHDLEVSTVLDSRHQHALSAGGTAHAEDLTHTNGNKQREGSRVSEGSDGQQRTPTL